MNRAERRRAAREQEKAKTATYNLTRAQLEAMVHKAAEEELGERLKRIKQEATDDAINTAMTLLLTLPLEVLMDYYWPKTYQRKIPEFTQHVLDYYTAWQNGELDMEKLKEDLWEYAGIRLEESE